MQRVEHGEAQRVLLRRLRVRRGGGAHVGVLDEAQQLLELGGVVAGAGERLLERGDGGELVLLHDAAELRRQRDVPLRRQLEQLEVFELLHEGRHVVL